MEKQNNIRAIWLRLFALLAVFTGLAGCSEDEDKTNVSPEISLNKTNLVLEVGSSERLTASFNPPEAPNKGHMWTSSAANIATVDETGMVTAITVGNAVITAQALDGGKMASCNVQVVAEVVHVTGITLMPANESIAVGEQLQLTARVLPENATDKSVIWTSSNDAIATVDGTGQVTGIAAGSVVITATSNDGNKQATCQLTVSERGAMISAPEVTDVTSTTAHVSGSIRAMGVEIQERGLCYGTSPSPTVDGQKVTLSGEDVSYTLNGLSERTTYYVRLYAMVDGKVSYGEETEFMTTGEIRTHFYPVNIYSNQLYLKSEAPIGVESVNVCYGTQPNPTITDNIATAELKDDGLLLLHLSGLQPGTTYYIRAYSQTGSGIEYYDDEVSAQTVGTTSGDFAVEQKRIRFESYFGELGFTRYRVYWEINYNINIPGTYKVTAITGKASKDTSYNGEDFYISEGKGTFYFMQEDGTIEYEGRREFIFVGSTYIRFENIETGLCYYLTTYARAVVPLG